MWVDLQCNIILVYSIEIELYLMFSKVMILCGYYNIIIIIINSWINRGLPIIYWDSHFLIYKITSGVHLTSLSKQQFCLALYYWKYHAEQVKYSHINNFNI